MGLVFIIYMIGVLPSFGKALCFLGFIGCAVSAIMLFVALAESLEPECRRRESSIIQLRKYAFLKTAIFIWMLGFLIPEEKVMYTMLAAYGVNEVITNPKVQELGGKSLEVLEKAMNEYIGEEKGEEK